MIKLMVTSGRGPAECRIALVHALSAMSKEALRSGLDLDIAHGPALDKHGPGSAIVLVEGESAAHFAKRWIGSVLWISPSPVRPHHKRKNWFIGISELPPSQTVPSTLALSDIRFEAFRAGGPGGQHQNKTESAVRAVHTPSGLSVVARDDRSQHRNKAVAIERLGQLLQLQQVLARDCDRALAQSSHDHLERGKPVRRFTGPKFDPA
jgi:peptide chain release factor